MEQVKPQGHLVGMIGQGDVYYNIKGSTPEEVLTSLVRVVRTPKSMDKQALREALIERESIATTAIGKGFAIPHPRRFLAKDEKDAMVVVAYLETPVDWHALDGEMVTALFLVLSADVQNHLSALSSIACLAGKEDFRKLMTKEPSKKELLGYLSTKNC